MEPEGDSYYWFRLVDKLQLPYFNNTLAQHSPQPHPKRYNKVDWPNSSQFFLVDTRNHTTFLIRANPPFSEPPARPIAGLFMPSKRSQFLTTILIFGTTKRGLPLYPYIPRKP
jgi:hypothetical protein